MDIVWWVAAAVLLIAVELLSLDLVLLMLAGGAAAVSGLGVSLGLSPESGGGSRFCTVRVGTGRSASKAVE